MEKHQSDLRKVCSQDDASQGEHWVRRGDGDLSRHPLLSILYSPHQGVAPRDMEWSGLLARTLLFTSDMLPFVYLFLKLGIQGFNKQDIGSHQSYSRKTLIALVTSGVLLAILGTTGYFLMNRRSWSPTGERLVSSGEWGKANEEDNELLGRHMDIMRGKGKIP